MASKKERQLNYELLRILAMLMIVCLHYLSKGGFLGDPARADLTATGYTAWLVEAFCLVAVNVYVLISGYFGADNNQNSFHKILKRPLKVWYQVFFYSMGIGLLALLIGAQQFDLYQFFTYCFPIVTEHYWFASAYVVLCLLMPFLNAGMERLGQKEAGCLLAGLLMIFSIAKTVMPMHLPWDQYGYDIMWFVVLYLTGAYLKRFEVKTVNFRFRAAVLYIGSACIIFLSFLLLRAVYLRTGKLADFIQYGYSYNFLFCYTGAIGLFLAFRQKQEGLSWGQFTKPIRLFSSATFGVYLIHEHINIRWEWPKWFHCEAQAESSVVGFLAHMVLTVMAVYLVCTAIELLRMKLFEGIRKLCVKS